MKHLLPLIAGAMLGLATAAQADPKPAATAADAATSTTTAFSFPAKGDTRLVGADEIATLLKSHNSDLLVVNFWATWCGPCVEELPYFVKLSQEYPESKVRVVGLSVDLKRDLKTKVIPFLQKRGIPFAVLVVFAEQDKLISTFSPDWGGEVPATFFFDKNGKKLGEVLAPMTEEELRAEVKKHLPAN